MLFIGLIVWGFVWAYVFNRGLKRILGLLLAFFPAITIVSVFLADIASSPRELSYVLSTVSYHFTFYVLPSAIGYVAGFLTGSRRQKRRERKSA